MNKDNKDMEKVLLEDERISHFLQGLMDVSEEAAFRKELNSNKELRQRASVQARLIKGMKQADEELLNAFKKANGADLNQVLLGAKMRTSIRKGAAAFCDDDGDISDKPIKMPSKSSIRKFIVAASIILIFFVGYKSYDYYDTTSLGKEYAKIFPVSSIVRGETNENVEAELIALFDKVTNVEDLDQTISSLVALWQIAKKDTYNDYTDYAPYIGWYLAIAYLEDYEKEKAKDVLKEIEMMYPVGTAINDKIKILIEKI